MGLFTSKQFGSLEDLFEEQIADLYDAEVRITKALAKMAASAELEELKTAFNTHLRETEVQVERLERVFEQLGKEPRRETCAGIKGLITEGSEMISAYGDGGARDAGLIAAAQRVEHYEMAGYGTARSLAEHLGHKEAARLLQQTLDEEMKTDKLLTAIAERSIYAQKPETSGNASSKKQANGNGKGTKARRQSGSNGAKSSSKSRSSSTKSSKTKRRTTAKSR